MFTIVNIVDIYGRVDTCNFFLFFEIMNFIRNNACFQVRQSFFLDMDLDYTKKEAKEIIRLLYQQFYSGSNTKATEM